MCFMDVLNFRPGKKLIGTPVSAGRNSGFFGKLPVKKIDITVAQGICNFGLTHPAFPQQYPRPVDTGLDQIAQGTLPKIGLKQDIETTGRKGASLRHFLHCPRVGKALLNLLTDVLQAGVSGRVANLRPGEQMKELVQAKGGFSAPEVRVKGC